MKEETHDRQHAIRDEETIIRQILKGNTELFAHLVNRYAEDVLRVIGRIVSGQEDAEDILQDVFVAAYQGLGGYEHSKASFKTWLLNIAYHTSLKRIQRTPSYIFVSIEEESFDFIAEADMDELLNGTAPDRLTLLDKAIKLLAPNDQLLLSLYYYDDMKLKDIAHVMACTDSYLRSRLQWIRKKLCHTIKTFENNEDK